MYKSRRAAAAAAAEASAMQPINANSTRRSAAGDKRAAASSAGTGTSARSARITKPPRLMAPPPPRDRDGQLAVLQQRGTIDADEVYGEQEKALSEFLRLHPMLSVTNMHFKHAHSLTVTSRPEGQQQQPPLAV